VLWLLIGCAGSPAVDANLEGDTLPTIEPADLSAGEKLQVVATTSIVGDVVGNVANNDVDLVVLIPPGQDPHSYQLTARQQAAVADADLVFVSGFDLEESLLGTIEASATGPVISVSAGTVPRQLQAGEQAGEGPDHSGVDPHVWMDVQNVLIWTNNIVTVLSQADPVHAEDYTTRADAYDQQLQSLDEYIRQQIDSIPPEQRKLVTDHDAFGYFADAYGLQIIGTVIPGLSTTASANAGDLARLVQTLDEAGVSTIFVGTTSGDQIRRLVDAITTESGRDIQVLSLYSGSLGSPGTPADTYIGMMRFNTEQIVSGLSN